MSGAAANAERFHNSALSDAATAQTYVETEWEESRIKQRYEWLFTYDATTVAV